MALNPKILSRDRRHKRVRSKISGTEARPRLSVYKSNRGIYAQLIDDQAEKTILGISSLSLKGTPAARAKALGEKMGEEAKKKGIKDVVFDRGGFLYAGSVQIFADSARSSGLKF